jgi:hypothetical protein
VQIAGTPVATHPGQPRRPRWRPNKRTNECPRQGKKTISRVRLPAPGPQKKEEDMGTRHLIAVVIDGEYKIAQYGQWDGYFEGQGSDILEFLRGDFDEELFTENLRSCHFLDKDEVKRHQAKFDEIGSQSYFQIYFHLSRDCGSKVLELVQGQPLGLGNSIDFAGDSLFCEFAYVLDFDKRTFEVYKGFNMDKLEEGERFASFDANDNDYKQVKFVKEFSLDNLPNNDDFLADCYKAAGYESED